ncbi:MAG TPA: hypothetical protein VKV04_24345 [Verrucomicrobiae bacterium]|nr:hypothetical protein [Verrucomicrobiae bacterium]
MRKEPSLARHSQSGAISRKLIVWLSIPIVLFVLFVGGRSAVRYKYNRERADWKDVTIPWLAGLSLSNREISGELDSLKAGGNRGIPHDWTGGRVLLMTNGEYLIYGFRHGFNDGFVDHLFLARGSDGHWYYSTYHFCNQMTAVFNDDPPGSIAEFAKRYSVRQFDGKSDVCLQHTWP